MPFGDSLKSSANIAIRWPSAADTECTNMIAALVTLLRWAREGGEVHP